jgi:hypothetical protein
MISSQKILVPCQPSGRRVIPSECPSVYCSIHLDDVSYRLDARQTKHHPSGRLSSPSGRLLVIDQLQILSKFNLREDCFNRPNDVNSHPDALIHKARIAIQISPSRRQSALVRTRVQQLRKLRIRLQPFGRLPIMVQTQA